MGWPRQLSSRRSVILDDVPINGHGGRLWSALHHVHPLPQSRALTVGDFDHRSRCILRFEFRGENIAKKTVEKIKCIKVRKTQREREMACHLARSVIRSRLLVFCYRKQHVSWVKDPESKGTKRGVFIEAICHVAFKMTWSDTHVGVGR